jgi:hypothetical protein
MFALDAFEPGLNIWRQLGDFVMHLIPSFILIAFLIVAWKWERIGGVLFMIIGLGFSPFIFTMNFRHNHSIWISLGIISLITLPFVIVGILFLISNSLKRRKSASI